MQTVLLLLILSLQALEAQSMLASLTSRCFTKCVDKPGERGSRGVCTLQQLFSITIALLLHALHCLEALTHESWGPLAADFTFQII